QISNWDTAHGWGNHATVGYELISNLGTMAYQAKINVDIDGGTIDGTTIGATSAASGKFSGLTNTSISDTRIVYSVNGVMTGNSNVIYDYANNFLKLQGATPQALFEGRVYAG